MARKAKPVIVKLRFGLPRGGGAKETGFEYYWGVGRENAIITDRFGSVLGFWEVTEPDLRKCFETRDYAYFHAEDDGAILTITGPAPDQDW